MYKFIYLIILLTLFIETGLFGQSQHFIIKMMPFSSNTYDEFSPVFYKGGIVFCSNQSNNSLVNFEDEQSRLFNIVYVSKKDSLNWQRPKILAKELTTYFNDGPVTFTENGNVIYYSRNNSIENSLRNISDTSNKLGIYSAELLNGIWTNIKAFTYNDPLYNFFTPALTPEGDRIYFSSDKPGGIGGMDLYYCDKLNDDWARPINLGPVINTPKNESFPFAGKYDKLFFASDGHKGLGGKDLFYTQEINGIWIVPVHMDSSINSGADDFALVSDSAFENGFFSSNRNKTDDIFSFNAPPVEFTNCDSIKENNYCFTFYDEQHKQIDTIPVNYQWDFGNGIIRLGTEVKHCFPGPGKYLVKLSIIDKLTGEAIANQVNYNVDLENIQQAYINSFNVGMVDRSISFDGNKINLKDFRITDYLWNFGDGFKPGGLIMTNTFKKKGEYIIKLGMLGEKDSLGLIPKKCIMKKIRIYDDYQELTIKGKKGEDEGTQETDSAEVKNKLIQARIYFMDDLAERQKNKIRETLKEAGKLKVVFDQYGIIPDSYPFLDNLAGILKENPDIRLEIVLHAVEDKITGESIGLSEKLSRELTFYFKNKEVNMNAIRCKGFGLSYQVFKPFVLENKSIDGILEFIFMKI